MVAGWGACSNSLAGSAAVPSPVSRETHTATTPADARAQPRASAKARDAFVLLSGGGTPLSNNYSQYLQAKAMGGFLLARYPADSVWIFFGVGNREGEPARLSDVRRQVKGDQGLVVESWVPGALPHSRPATKAAFLTALRDEILPAVSGGGTLFLFIGDHGTQASKEPKESLVTLWQLKSRDGASGWRTDNAETLGVTELREALASGLGKGRVVFCMTQCHSGGFHFLGVPRAAQPNLDWFNLVVPDWAAPTESAPWPAAAGFTAVDEDSLAAGCDPDPDPDQWAGYERFVPEALLGVDLFSGARLNDGLPSYAAAHARAVLVDRTIDKPRSTSEQFLERWAALIERLDGEKSLTPRIRAAADAYLQSVNAGLAPGAGGEFQARRAQYEQFIARMAEQSPGTADLLRQGTRTELQQASGSTGSRSGSGGGPGRPGAIATTWKEAVRPAWKAAVEAGTVVGLAGPALTFEKHLLAQEEKGRELMFARGWQNPMLNDLFWQSGYAFPGQLDRGKAEAVTRWGAERRAKIAEWASGSSNDNISAWAASARPRRPGGSGAVASPPTLRRNIAAERTLFYRRTLAAWAFLSAVDEAPALAELHRLIVLEQTPLPSPTIARR